jgi:hypothetical protein
MTEVDSKANDLNLAFNLLDLNHDGKLTVDELKKSQVLENYLNKHPDIKREVERLKKQLLKGDELSEKGKQIADIDEEDGITWTELMTLDQPDESGNKDGYISNPEFDNAGTTPNDENASDSDANNGDGEVLITKKDYDLFAEDFGDGIGLPKSITKEEYDKLKDKLTAGEKAILSNFYYFDEESGKYKLNALGQYMATRNGAIPDNEEDDYLGLGEFWGDEDNFLGLDIDQNGEITQEEIDKAWAKVSDKTGIPDTPNDSDGTPPPSDDGTPPPSDDGPDNSGKTICPSQECRIGSDGHLIGPDGEDVNISDWEDGVYRLFSDDRMEVDAIIENGVLESLTTTIYNKDKTKAAVFTQDSNGNVALQVWTKNEDGDWVLDDRGPRLPQIEGDKDHGKGSDGTENGGTTWHHDLKEEFGIDFKYFCPSHSKEYVQIKFLDQNGYTIKFGDSEDNAGIGFSITTSENGIPADNLPEGLLGPLFDEDDGAAQTVNRATAANYRLSGPELPPFIDWGDNEDETEDEEQTEDSEET